MVFACSDMHAVAQVRQNKPIGARLPWFFLEAKEVSWCLGPAECATGLVTGPGPRMAIAGFSGYLSVGLLVLGRCVKHDLFLLPVG